jgi:hypothetical protein
LKGIIVALIAWPLPAQPVAERPVAPGWTAAESAAYKAAIDRRNPHSGSASLTLTSLDGARGGYAASQRISAGAYRGKRIRLSGWFRTAGTDRGGALWLRIDMANGDYVLDGVFESSSEAWKRQDIVGAVPPDAIGISFGVRVAGKGQVWADDFALQIVPGKTPTNTIERRKNRTAGNVGAQYQTARGRPVNLGFED